MPIDPTKLANLLTLAFTGKPAVCAYWHVKWDPNDVNQDRYYSDAEYNQMVPFLDVGVSIEARILGSIVKDTQFEINPDLRTETISLTFDDIDREISNRFQTYKSGVRCSLSYYYPDVDLTIPDVWFGQLQAPEVYGRKTIKTKATNGYRSREQQLPRRPRPRECTSVFGAYMPNAFARETNLCPYEDGVLGLAGQTDCTKRDETICNTKLATTDGKYFGGFDTDASATLTDSNSGFIAVSKGNTSALTHPIRVIAGQKYIRGLQMLLWRREINSNDANRGWVRGIWEVGEGPVKRIFNFKVKEKLIESLHLYFALGGRGQPPSGYAASVPNFSFTAYTLAAYGWVNPLEETPSTLPAACNVDGYTQVAVFSNPSTYARQWCDDRVWWLFELHTNQRWGMAHDSSRFEIADWITASQWTRDTVSFTALFRDGESIIYSGRRSIFDCALEARPVAEQLTDICRSGSLSIPFQHEGKYTIRPIRVATAGELSAARVFTDAGSSRNITWDKEQPALTLSQTPDDKLINEVTLNFEEASNFDVERSVSVDDPNQKLLAGRSISGDPTIPLLHPVPKKYAAFGCRYVQEVVRLAYRILRFGEFDQGGTQNNLKAVFTTSFEHVLGLKRYEIIKIVSNLLDPFTIGTDDGVNDFIEVPQYFRIQKMKKIGSGLVEVTAQAYNHTAYTAFETVTVAGTGTPPTEPGGTGGGGSPPPPDPDPDPCPLTFGTVTYDSANGLINVPIPPC